MNPEYKHYRSKRQYKRKKNILIIATVVLLFLISLVVLLSGLKQHDKQSNTNYISAGICGAIKKPGVYRLPVNSSLADLLMLGNGLTHNADIRNIDLNTVLQNDSIYHLPVRKHNDYIIKTKAIQSLSPIPAKNTKGEEVNFLYIGYPALYFLINYNTKTNKTLVTYIPHSSLFLDNEYRLIDIYFTLGRDYTIDLLQKSLGIKIDHYFVQDRSSFIAMIDQLGGLNINLDEWYAEEYNLKPGRQVIDGFHSFEFIRYIQKKTKITILKGDNLQLAYNLRQSRMKQTISALFCNFKKSAITKKLSTLAAIMRKNNTETNINIKALSQLIDQVQKNPKLNFETIHGYYIKKNNNLYYIPTEWNFKKLRKHQELNNYQVIKGEKQQILY